MLKIIFTSFILLMSIIFYSQNESRYINGEVIVQLSEAGELNDLLSKEGLILKETLSERFNIYLLSDKSKTRNNFELQSAISNYPSVIYVQINHKITLRKSEEIIPNDSLFNKQWSLLNTGQVSGYEGADIDATSAWNFTTGGTTVLGDTIVIAVVDGGCDIDHEDLDIWINHNEIPDNNIDDDNNGYIDDYYGWNAYNNSGDIPDNLHGTHVSGIAGAIGNNEKGVAGVNWNVKILPIAGESTYESIVVKALSYIYVQREMYDNTNGEKGAFIVAQNNSFGVDEAQPAEYPIWEAMYDSLGSIGILSMGATANRPWDIDVVGDVPTAFTTPYMISVTNTTNKDVKNGGAAWGATTIDIGAPGTMIWSLGLNNSYRTSTGTSMATPHVSGAAALMFAAADSAFMEAYKANPGEYALLIKEYLMQGVDKLPDLDTATVSGGRLNIYNSINLMLDIPNLEINKTTINKEIPLNYTTTDTLLLTNKGGSSFDYNALIPLQPDWISLSKTNGTLAPDNTDTIVVTFSTLKTDTGTYNCNININYDLNTTQIPVELRAYDNTGIEENKLSNLKIYPIPFTDKLKFELISVREQKVDISIYSIMGFKVHSSAGILKTGINLFECDTKEFEEGTYIYRILIDKDTQITGKVVKKNQ